MWTVTLYFISNRGGLGDGVNKHKWKQNIQSKRQLKILKQKKTKTKHKKNPNKTGPAKIEKTI